jgi:hypothetical protein
MRNQMQWTHSLCWNIQRSFDWSEYLFWEIRVTGLTIYVGTCKGYLTDQNIFCEKSEALDSHSMLEHPKVIWLVRTFFLRSQRSWTHILSKSHLTNQKSASEKSEALDSQPLLEYPKVIWLMRISFLRNQRTYTLCWNMQIYLTNQNILSEKSEALDSHSMLEHPKVIWLIRTSFLRSQRLWTHILYWNIQRSFN